MFIALHADWPLQQLEYRRWCGCPLRIRIWRSREEPRNADWYLRIECNDQSLELGLSDEQFSALDELIRQARQSARFGAAGPPPLPPEIRPVAARKRAQVGKEARGDHRGP